MAAYFKPFIDLAGLHFSSYQDILDHMVEGAKNLFGQDIYLGNDALDYQFLSIIALKINDQNQAVQEVFNNRGPSTGIGSGLDIIVKMNGLKRQVASYSTCQVTLTGVAGTIINNGIVQDISGKKWNLPSSVTIGIGVTLIATATCQTIGAINALTSDISIITTPQAGWRSEEHTSELQSQR